MREEIAPAELAAVLGRTRALPAAGLGLELERGEAAEMQVGREPGGPAREAVMVLGVAGEAVAKPLTHRPPRGALPGIDETARRIRRPQRSECRQPAARNTGGNRKRVGGCLERAARSPEPGSVEGREDAVGAALGGADGGDVGREVARMGPLPSRRRGERGPDALVARLRERGHIISPMDGAGAPPRRRGAGFGRQPPSLITSAPPRSRIEAASSRRQPCRKAARAGAGKRPRSSPGSRMKTGTTRSWSRAAALSAGLSWRRRSRRSHTIAVEEAGRRPAAVVEWRRRLVAVAITRPNVLPRSWLPSAPPMQLRK